MLMKLVSNVLQTLPRAASQNSPGALVKSLDVPSAISSQWGLTFVRTKIRNHFPYAHEGKRIKTHGWLARMSTPSGRRVLMRRILKGRRVLSH